MYVWKLSSSWSYSEQKWFWVKAWISVEKLIKMSPGFKRQVPGVDFFVGIESGGLPCIVGFQGQQIQASSSRRCPWHCHICGFEAAPPYSHSYMLL